MNETEAKTILTREMTRYRGLTYAELLALVDEGETFERAAPSGVAYQVEVQVLFDDGSTRHLHVIGAIDDGGWRAFVPLTDDFIMAPDGSFVGE